MVRCFRSVPLAGALLIAACGDPGFIPRENFPEMAAGAICDRIKECARGDFDKDYFGMGDCVSHWERAMRETDKLFRNLGCDYDEEGAARAWRNLRGMSCESFYEGEYVEDYDKVWDC